MVAGSGGAMEPDTENQNKLDEYLSMMKRRRSDTEASRYTTRVRNYATLQEKRRRAAAARKKIDRTQKDQLRKKVDGEQQNTTQDCDRQGEDGEHVTRRRRGECMPDGRRSSMSWSRSREPIDRCCRRRRRRRRSRRRRRRSCRRRRRRRRSCRRRRRRRRSCRRRRRRRCR